LREEKGKRRRELKLQKENTAGSLGLAKAWRYVIQG
jgi:hypothetical protein